MNAAASAGGPNVRVSFNVFNPLTMQYLSEYRFRFAHSVNTQTELELRTVLMEGLQVGLSDAEIAKQMSTEVFGAKRTTLRAQMIARTEEARATMAGQLQAFRESGVVESKRWLIASDACQFCQAISEEFNGQASEIELNGVFVQQGAMLDGVDGGVLHNNYAPVEHPPLHVHCRCDLVPVIIGDKAAAIGEKHGS